MPYNNAYRFITLKNCQLLNQVYKHCNQKQRKILQLFRLPNIFIRYYSSSNAKNYSGESRLRLFTFGCDSDKNVSRSISDSHGHGSHGHDLKNQIDFGILFDVDGVLAKGSFPLDPAKKAMAKLKDSEGNFKVPVAFVTNSSSRSVDKAHQIGNWFDITVLPEHVIVAPTPVKLLREFHDQYTLVIGQQHKCEIAHDLGFKNVCTIEDLKEAYPLLDMVDHKNRVKVASKEFEEYKVNPYFPKVDVILVIGEPCHWETDLQILIDLLLTEGEPNKPLKDPLEVSQVSVIACNMDLVYSAEASMPRFGNGAFLLCLETLYKKITGKELVYKSLVGKPCEITYRYAEHTIAKIAKQMGIIQPIKRLYFLGFYNRFLTISDNPNVDIVGANLYNRYIKRQQTNTRSVNMPASRLFPVTDELEKQTVDHIHGILVGTGVYRYRPAEEITTETIQVDHGHRDFDNEPELSRPHQFVPDVNDGIDFIFGKEGMQ
ncbi:unnamed protein product [Lymnaea stagnalis]|uniref:Haloacid dehalogenase-like hydrolase domain-containing 5 n=1 Tax=Lymnaea stagnalis TaxID=6523 RepID=A0AAV2HCZ8_LYMST